MIDTHIHIGRFYDVYYNPIDILRIVSEADVKHVEYSSTTSFDDNARYKDVEKEIAEVTAYYSSDYITPFLWYIPPYIDEGVSAAGAFENLPYGGIKLHPRAHFWDLEDEKHLKCLHELFTFAGERGLSVLIHTGEDNFERPCFFERFFAEYPEVKCVLAHCRPVAETIEMFQRYENVSGDTAFLSKNSFEKIVRDGFGERLLPGSDFPITHYCRTKYLQEREGAITLGGQYVEDLRKMVEFVSKKIEG